MRCKNCDYRLWNLKSRQCPECGTPYLPSEFEFLLNSVQFCCQHCNQSYYGTGAKGLLSPQEFDCVSCRRHIHMDDMILLPTEGVGEVRTKVDPMPWLECRSDGAIKAWFSTVKRALVAPGRLIGSVPIASSVGSAVWFALFTNALVYFVGLISVLIFSLIFALSMSGLSGFGGGPMGPGMPRGASMVISMAAGMGGFGVVAFAVVSVFMLVTALVTHGLLRLTGPTESTLGRTFHAICYSSGANAASAIPCMGFYFGWIWWLISAVLMVRTGQKVHGGRAAFAVLTVPLLSFGTFIGLYVWLIVTAMTGAGPFAMTGATVPTQTILNGLLDYNQEQNKAGPDHAIQLVAGDYVTGFDLVATGSNTLEKHVPVADTTLDKFSGLSAETVSETAQAAIDALPANTIAHRLGDFVFTYHGVDFADANPGLWLVVMSPDPDVNPAPVAGPVITSRGPGMISASTTSSGGMVVVGLADGSVRPLFLRAFSVELSAQNALRAKYNLPPLPDPATVTHAKPAVAGNQPQIGETIPDPPEPNDESSAEEDDP